MPDRLTSDDLDRIEQYAPRHGDGYIDRLVAEVRAAWAERDATERVVEAARTWRRAGCFPGSEVRLYDALDAYDRDTGDDR